MFNLWHKPLKKVRNGTARVRIPECKNDMNYTCIHSDRHDKPFCTKAITKSITSKKPIPMIAKLQFLEAISVIDKLSPINFSDKC